MTPVSLQTQLVTVLVKNGNQTNTIPIDKSYISLINIVALVPTLAAVKLVEFRSHHEILSGVPYCLWCWKHIWLLIIAVFLSIAFRSKSGSVNTYLHRIPRDDFLIVVLFTTWILTSRTCPCILNTVAVMMFFWVMDHAFILHTLLILVLFHIIVCCVFHHFRRTWSWFFNFALLMVALLMGLLSHLLLHISRWEIFTRGRSVVGFCFYY